MAHIASMSSSIDCSDRTRSASSPLRANRSATTTIGGMAIAGTSSLLERAPGGRPAGAGPGAPAGPRLLGDLAEHGGAEVRRDTADVLDPERDDDARAGG